VTERKHLKQLVRARMGKTGESYTTARRQIIRQAPQPSDSSPTPHHFPGSIPAPAALRALLSQAGIRNPHTGAPLSEAMVFGIAGGIGAGVFAFYYSKEDFSSFFIAGRHLWQDDLGWTRQALARLGLEPVVKESAGVKPGERQLRELLEGGRPVMAWLDAAGLPHRAMPAKFSGGAYHVVAIHEVDDAAGAALVGDLADDPVPVPLADLARARARIKKFKNRILAVDRASGSPDFATMVRSGIRASVEALTTCKMKNFRLDAFANWADRLDGSKAADSWEKMFPPGHRLYQGLWSITEYIEHYGTGGGLCRPLFAEFLEEAGAALTDPGLTAAAARYAELGRGWTALAEAALPDRLPELAQTRALLARRSEYRAEGAGATAEVAACWKGLEEQAQRLKRKFPLDATGSAALRRDLKARVTALHAGEVEALDTLRRWL
jgi:hypothetical protein